MTGVEQTRLLYCMGCGEEVPTYSVEVRDQVEIRCAYCGFTVEIAEPGTHPVRECVLLADDDLLFRRLLSDILLEEKLVKEAIAHDSGPALLTECVRRLRDQRPINLVIVDILMPPMDGRAVVFALRALEKGFELPGPIPVLFLSAVRADDSLRRTIEDCAPAMYLNKAKDPRSPELANRLKDIVRRLLKLARAR